MDLIHINVKDRIALVRLCRPEKKNALTAAMYLDLARALNRADQDPEVRVIVLTGTEGVFTSGNDLNEFVDNPVVGPNGAFFQFFGALTGVTKPLVAAVDGLAVGIGATMLLHCDLVFATRRARFQFPFVNLGVVPEAASSLLLPRIVGSAFAAELMLFGEMFDAERAHQLGLVNSVVPDETLEKFTLTRARTLASKPAGAIRLIKHLLREREPADIAARNHLESRLFGERLLTPEFAEAMAAFRERRQPDFSRFD
jgi:enoyl-CoA hydratase/carnithine racemase